MRGSVYVVDTLRIDLVWLAKVYHLCCCVVNLLLMKELSSSFRYGTEL